MTQYIRKILLSGLCVLSLSAPAHAWSEMPAEAQKIIDEGGTRANCSAGCPEGTRMKTVPGGPPAFENCTDAYQFYIANGFELVMTLFMQYAQAYSSDYLAACRNNTSRITETGLANALRVAAEAKAEAEAVPAVMRRLIEGRIAGLVPAHCRNNKPAQEEAAAGFDEWAATTSAYYKEEIAGYIKGDSIECGQFVDTHAARIYETDFTGTPVLGITATLAFTRHPKEEEVKKSILDYKSAYEAAKKP